jgi:hypothetical protein
MSIVGLPADPVPFVTLTFDEPAVIVRFAATPGDVSTTIPVPPGSPSPPEPDPDPGPDVAQVSVPAEFIQQSPAPVFAYIFR